MLSENESRDLIERLWRICMEIPADTANRNWNAGNELAKVVGELNAMHRDQFGRMVTLP